MYTNWHSTSQGPKKKSIQITKGKIDHCPAPTARNKGSFTRYYGPMDRTKVFELNCRPYLLVKWNICEVPSVWP